MTYVFFHRSLLQLKWIYSPVKFSLSRYHQLNENSTTCSSLIKQAFRTNPSMLAALNVDFVMTFLQIFLNNSLISFTCSTIVTGKKKNYFRNVISWFPCIVLCGYLCGYLCFIHLPCPHLRARIKFIVLYSPVTKISFKTITHFVYHSSGDYIDLFKYVYITPICWYWHGH